MELFTFKYQLQMFQNIYLQSIIFYQFRLIFLYPGDGDVNLAFTITQNNLTKLINNQAEYTYADENGFYLKKSY